MIYILLFSLTLNIIRSTELICFSLVCRLTIKQSEDVTLTCKVEGTPRPTILWSKVGEDLNSPNIVVNGETLTIRNAAVSDRGVYVCTVENNAGTTRASAVLEVDRR